MRFKRLTVLWRFQYKVFVLVFTAGQYFFFLSDLTCVSFCYFTIDLFGHKYRIGACFSVGLLQKFFLPKRLLFLLQRTV